MHMVALCLQHGAQKSAGRAFAIGARDVKDRRQLPFGMAKPRKNRADGAKTDAVFWQRQFTQPVKLALHRRVFGNCEVFHTGKSLRIRRRAGFTLRSLCRAQIIEQSGQRFA